MKEVYVVHGICSKHVAPRDLETHIGLYVADSEEHALGLHTKFLISMKLRSVTIHATLITETCQTLLAEAGKIYPTEDAYMAACRAGHWRNGQLRAYGIEPLQLTPDMPHYPPEDFDWQAAEAIKSPQMLHREVNKDRTAAEDLP